MASHRKLHSVHTATNAHALLSTSGRPRHRRHEGRRQAGAGPVPCPTDVTGHATPPELSAAVDSCWQSFLSSQLRQPWGGDVDTADTWKGETRNTSHGSSPCPPSAGPMGNRRTDECLFCIGVVRHWSAPTSHHAYLMRTSCMRWGYAGGLASAESHTAQYAAMRHTA